MRRSAKILCAFGSIAILCAIIALLIFDHIPSPWGAGTLPDGFGKTEIEMDELGLWQARVIVSFFGAALAGAMLLFGGSMTYLISRFKP
jgi:hypothetical protein